MGQIDPVWEAVAVERLVGRAGGVNSPVDSDDDFVVLLLLLLLLLLETVLVAGTVSVTVDTITVELTVIVTVYTLAPAIH